MRLGSGGVGTLERRELRDEPLDAFRLRAARARDTGTARAGAASSSATASLAAIIRCSIRRCDSVCVRARISVTSPRSSKTNSGSSRVDGQRAALLARALQRRGGLARGRERRRPRLPRLLLAGEDAVDALVVQTLVRADHRAIEGSRARPRRRAARARPSRPGARAPDTSEQASLDSASRQHRLDGARHVDARRAPARLDVDRRALGHVRAHVGDVHPHARAARRRAPRPRSRRRSRAR